MKWIYAPPHVTLSGMMPSFLRIGPFIKADKSSLLIESRILCRTLSNHPT